jgi:hypothetical protein
MGLSFDDSAMGKLIACNIYPKDGYYYRQQTFEYSLYEGGDISTCSLSRLTSYAHKEEVETAIQETVLGTWRKVWITQHGEQSCMDETIKNYYTTIGVSLMSIYVAPFIVFGCYLAYHRVYKSPLLPPPPIPEETTAP